MYTKDNTQIIINTSETHNKFWMATTDANNTVHIRWGRIGLIGQTQEKSFVSAYQAAAFVQSKISSKMRNGYVDNLHGQPVDSAMLEKLAIEAAVVGTQNKCHNMQWVEIITGGTDPGYQFIPDQRLYEPDCVPGLLVSMETRKPYEGLNKFSILFTGDAAYHCSSYQKKISKTDELYELTKKVEEAVGRSLS